MQTNGLPLPAVNWCILAWLDSRPIRPKRVNELRCHADPPCCWTASARVYLLCTSLLYPSPCPGRWLVQREVRPERTVAVRADQKGEQSLACGGSAQRINGSHLPVGELAELQAEAWPRRPAQRLP